MTSSDRPTVREGMSLTIEGGRSEAVLVTLSEKATHRGSFFADSGGPLFAAPAERGWAYVCDLGPADTARIAHCCSHSFDPQYAE